MAFESLFGQNLNYSDMVLLGAIDQGTSSTRFLIFETTGEIVTSHQIEVRQHFPNPGWVEMDPLEIFDTVRDCISKAVDKLEKLGISPDEIKSVGISNQRETTIVWDKETGEPLFNAIVWLDNRTASLAEDMIQKTSSGSKDEFMETSGLPIHPYFSALKLNWLMQNVDAVKDAHDNDCCLLNSRSVSRQTVCRHCMSQGGICLQQGSLPRKQTIRKIINLGKTEYTSGMCMSVNGSSSMNTSIPPEALIAAHYCLLFLGRLLFGTVDSWIIWKLTGEHVTDVTNASRTMLLDLYSRKWSEQLCKFFDIPMEILPKIKSSAEIYGHISEGPLKDLPISGCLGDQQAAMVGHNCLKKGDTKITYGTGTFMLTNIGTKVTISKNGLLTTVGFQFGPDSPTVYALEGSGSIGGNVVRFLRDNFKFIKSASDMENICRSVKSTEGVVFVPCFTGLYTPYWDPSARGTLLGLTQATSRAHICLAALRAVAYQSAEMVKAVEQDIEDPNFIKSLKTDGGMTANKLFNEIQAEIIGKVIKTPQVKEISGWGAAVAGGLGAQQISLDDFAAQEAPAVTYLPHKDERRRAEDLQRWKEAVKRACGWAHTVSGYF